MLTPDRGIRLTMNLDHEPCTNAELHCRDEAAVPFEEGRRVAAGIPGARFVALDGRNHLIFEHEPAWPRFLQEVRAFLD